jgi:glutathione S-transferase
LFDNDVMTAMQKPVFEAIKKDNARKGEAMAEARRVLDLAYAWLEQRLKGRTGAAGETLSLADCAASVSFALLSSSWIQSTPSLAVRSLIPWLVRECLHVADRLWHALTASSDV